MGQELLVTELIDAGADFLHEFDKRRRIAVAFWIIPFESDGLLYLYVASDEIDDGNLKPAYGEVLQILNDEERLWLDPFQVKLVSSADPIACDAIAIRDRRPAPIPTHYNGSSLGGTSIDGAYIYALRPATKSTK